MKFDNFGLRLLAIVIVFLFAAFGGEIIRVLEGKQYGKIKFKNRCTTLKMPPLVLMIVFGCVARNYFGSLFTDYYPEDWAS